MSEYTLTLSGPDGGMVLELPLAASDFELDAQFAKEIGMLIEQAVFNVETMQEEQDDTK